MTTGRVYFSLFFVSIVFVFILGHTMMTVFMGLQKINQRKTLQLSTGPALPYWSMPVLIDSEISKNDEYLAKLYRGDYLMKERYLELFVTSRLTGKTKKIFSGDPRTSDLRWTEDNNIRIVYDCGTGCRATKIISVDDLVTYGDYANGKMNEVNGWRVDFFKSF